NNLSRDPDNAYFADGIQDEILTRLAKIAELKVIARTSTQKYKSAPDKGTVVFLDETTAFRAAVSASSSFPCTKRRRAGALPGLISERITFDRLLCRLLRFFKSTKINNHRRSRSFVLGFHGASCCARRSAASPSSNFHSATKRAQPSAA